MIGLLGGTFDPIHDGHLHLATTLLEAYALTRLYLVPAYRNPLKSQSRTSAEDRLEMVRLAVTEVQEPRLGVLDWEVRAEGPSYTSVTLERLVPQLDEPVALVLGNEVFASLPRWHEPATVARLANVIVVARVADVPFRPEPVLAAIGIRDAVADGARVTHSGGTRWVALEHIDPLPFSGTAIRRDVAAGRRPEGLRHAVWRYIKEKRLYAVG